MKRKSIVPANLVKTILIGTYRKDQLEKWIHRRGFYNYPIRDCDTTILENAPFVSEIWLYEGKEGKRCFSAKFEKRISVVDLDAMGYPADMGPHHGREYLLFRVTPQDAANFQCEGSKTQGTSCTKSAKSAKCLTNTPGELRILVRLSDFAHDGDLRDRLEKRFASSAATSEETSDEKRKTYLDLLPADLREDVVESLCVCEPAEQLYFNSLLQAPSAVENAPDARDGGRGMSLFSNGAASSSSIRCVSLFSGAGGLDVGFERAGLETVFANEFDHDAAEAWRRNRSGREAVMAEGDINVRFEELLRLGNVDVVFGGPPCQGFSVAGKMDPADPRSNLVWRFMDAVEVLRPKVFVMENVAALGELDRWAGVRRKLADRAVELGYEASLRVHHTFEYGVPENRDRMIFIGIREGSGNIADFYAQLSKRRKVPPSVRQVLLSAGRFGSQENPDTCTAGISLALRPVMRRSPFAGMLVNGAGRPIDLDGIAPTLPASMGGNKTPIVDENALHDPASDNWFVQYHRRLLDGNASPRATAVPKFLRRLTVRESALIQTFPPEYIFVGKKTKQYRQIGNAVPCLFAYAVAGAVKDAFFSTGKPHGN